METALFNTIKDRRSIRRFKDRPVEDLEIERILDSARHAPSGMNNQPWRFAVIKNREVLDKLADCTKYGRVLLEAQTAIAVYLDNETSYNHLKDVQAVGACIQNLLLGAHALGLGAIWLGEILNRAVDVNDILKAPEKHELMAVIALGYPDERPEFPGRMEIEELVFARY